MEEGLLILRHLKVENANTVAGLTWGFPAISNFLGFVHALSRKLPKSLEFELTGCGVVCHSSKVQAYQPRGWGDYVFGLTRNPLTKEAKSPSFVEEGRMHMTVSLVIPFVGDLDDVDEMEEFNQLVEQLVLCQRLAGGTIISAGAVELHDPPEDDEGLKIFNRNQLRKLLPGFALVQRSDLLADHTRHCIERDPNSEALDAWLDFAALKFKAEQSDGDFDDNTQVQWHYVAKPGKGWLVPIPIGYRGVSDLYEPGVVARTRDATIPFRFVESVYTIGEWMSPHRIANLEQLIWRYHTESESGWYLCENNYRSSKD